MTLARRRIRNFGGNVSFVPARVYWPRNAQEVIDCMRRHGGERMRCIGAGHSWSAILATDGVLFDLRGLRKIQIDPSRTRVRVGAGCTVRRLLRHLRRENLTLPTLGAIHKQTVAGAVATGTHGSGCESLSHFVEQATIATFDPATGEPCLKTIDNGPELRAARCALGSLGIVVELVLQTVHRYRVAEQATKTSCIHEVLSGLDGEPTWPLQQFGLLPWSWQFIVYRRRQTDEAGSWLRARICRCANFWVNDVGLHVILKGLLVYASFSKWLQLIGSSRFTGEASIRAFFRIVHRLLPKDRRRIDDSTAILTQHHDCFRHVEMELFIPESKLCEAIAQIKEIVKIAAGESEEHPELLDELSTELRDEVWRLRGSYTLHYIMFFRRVLCEDTLVSMAAPAAHGDRAWYAISFFTYRKVDEAFARFAGTIAMCLKELYGARPHWGKYFPIPLEMAAETYPAFKEFRRICRKYDPKQQFWY